MEDIHIGDSIAVNGICLTVTSHTGSTFVADVMHETLNRSSLSKLRPGSHVNLERAMAADGRFGGHIVAGHVDGVGTVKSVQKDDNAIWYTIEAEPEILRYVVEKGSVTLDGISLTVASVTNSTLSISVIPHTAAITVLSERRPGDLVNIETDIISKYIEKLLLQQSPPPIMDQGGISLDFLQKNGF